MSDNPLADWLRERGAWIQDSDVDGSPPTALGPPAPAEAVGERLPPPAAPVGQELPPAAGDRGHGPVEPLPGDWSDDHGRPPYRTRRLLLLGLAAVPWLGFAAVALGTLGDPGDTTGAEGTGEDPAPAPAPRDPPTTAPGEATAHPPGPAAGTAVPGAAPPVPAEEASPSANDERRAGAAASLAIRTELTGEVADGSGVVRYVDLAVPESVEWVGDVAVVAVGAVVLESAGEEWGEARPERFAVPVRVTNSEAVPIAPPWPLPSRGDGEMPAWEPVEDADLAAAAADTLTEGGFDEVADLTLARSPDVPGVLAAEAAAIAPGAGAPATHRVWLRDADPPSLLADHR